MTLILDALGGLFSISSLMSFLFGVGSTVVFFKIEDWQEQRHNSRGKVPFVHKFRSLWVLWSMVFLLTGYIGLQQYDTARQVRKLAHDTVDCQRQFNAALKVRGVINDENDKLSRLQRDSLAKWFSQLLSPPSEILYIRENDPNFGTNPTYVKWSVDITKIYYNTVQKAQAQQDENTRKRPPYPEPSCGK